MYEYIHSTPLVHPGNYAAGRTARAHTHELRVHALPGATGGAAATPHEGIRS